MDRRSSARLVVAAVVPLLAACAGTRALMPTPEIYVGDAAKPLFASPPAEPEPTAVDMFYITDRVPSTNESGPLAYSAERSRSMAFGSVSVEIGESVPWPTLAAESSGREREVPLGLQLGAIHEAGRFPPLPYDVELTADGIARSHATMDLHETASAGLQDELASRLAAAPRKEIVLYVHGYANTFENAAYTMADFCHFLGREFVCGIFSWPAGGSRGMLAGYNVDRESGEFAVHHLKQAIRLIAQTPGVEKIHLMAHSRGTDVLATALRELGIEAYTAGSSLGHRFHVANVVLMAPDMDIDVAAAKVFGIVSDPDLRYGDEPNPRGAFPPLGLRLTVYVSFGDKALTLSQFMFGSLMRIGRMDVKLLTKEQAAKISRASYIATFIEVPVTPGFIDHSYFVTDPKVSADLIALIRYGLAPNEPGRPLEEVQVPFWRIEVDE